MRQVDYQKELNLSQAEAVRSTEGPYLVIAGAGSGKTRVLVYRVAYLVEKGIRPEEILLLTFTRKAAEEMLKRATSILDERCSKVSGGTFHSFANLILRKYARFLNLSNNFTILDRGDSEDTINLIRAKLGFHKSEKRFPRKGALLDIISKSVNKSESIERIVYAEYPQFMEWQEQIKKIQSEYADYKRLKSLLDYDDLLVYLKKLLTENEELRLKLAGRYKYIMVDEYQDTNKLQAHIVCLLAEQSQNIMVVGDDSQSIYSFRGANFKNIIDFPRIFKHTRIIKLEENYRSTQAILSFTNEIIHQAKDGFDKQLYSHKPGKGLPVYVEARDERAQAEYVAERILELREEGLELNDIAVLFRSGWHSNELEIELSRRNIPFAKYGGQKFVEAAHIKDILSYLRITHNASDHVSWHRLLLLMPGVGPKTAEGIIGEITARKENPLVVAAEDKISRKKPQVSGLFELLKKVDVNANSPADMLELFLEHYQPLLKEKYDDFNKRLNDLDSLIRISGRYKSLEQFLTDMALEPPERSLAEAGKKDRDDGRVTLSTIHSAKGLEWHTVFILYLCEGHIPSYLALEDSDAIEEERRLLYVAATRAKENLFLLKPHLDRSPRSYFDESASVFTRTSRFLDENNILDKFAVTESYTKDALDDMDLDDTKQANLPHDKELREMIKEYFHSDD
ncbi:ATP-dependent helicase [bacterium]|nr:MAG: ATP-dependent helicase [bacterium]